MIEKKNMVKVPNLPAITGHIRVILGGPQVSLKKGGPY